jgi:adenylate kinase family enzyme
LRDSLSKPEIGQRIVVVGTTGSGKTTLARRIATLRQVPHIELDALHWQANWTEAPLDVFRARIAQAVAGETWTLDGNSSRTRDLVWQRADTIIWIDYSLAVILLRLVRRTLRRVLAREELWNGNRETWRGTVFSRDSVLWWALKTYRRRRREYPELFARPEYRHLSVIRLRSPRKTEQWLVQTFAPPRE